MTFYKGLIGTGITVGVLGFLVLIFQATIFLIFGQWYGFSILEILTRLNLHDYLTTNVAGLDDTVNMLLNVPLTVVLIVIGGLIGFAGFHALRDELKWSRDG
jgi:hypothetical protein